MKRLHGSLIFSLFTAALLGAGFVSSTANAVTDRVVVHGLDKPWAVVDGLDGNVWVTEKPGAIKIFNSTFVLQKTLTGFPDFTPFGEGGILDLAFHPKFKSNGWIYVAYSVMESGGYFTRVNRFTYRGGKLEEHKVIFNGPTGTAGTHFGCRLLFDDEGFLLASFGERREMWKAQDMSLANGKIVRLTDDGEIPRTNPFGRRSPIFTLGHRNPQGLAIHPLSRKIYDSEHGPTVYDAPEGGDEINEITAGTNYGWPNFHHRMEGPGVQAPLLEYTPAVAPSGIAFYVGSKIPAWRNDLFVATLRGKHLLRIRIDAKGRVIETEKLLDQKYGRLRDVTTAPDGSLLVISEAGKMIQLK
ncbi:PQQ-dependent sugar dehydrogenase [soil metagenome]